MHLRQWPWLALTAILALAMPAAMPRLSAQSGKLHHRSTDDLIDPSSLDDATLKRQLEVLEENSAEMHLFDILREQKTLRQYDDRTLHRAMEIIRRNPELFQKYASKLKGTKLPDEPTRQKLIKDIQEKIKREVTVTPLKDNPPKDTKPNDNNGSTDKSSDPSSSKSGTEENSTTETPTPDKQDWTEKLLEDLLGTVDEKDLLDIFKGLGLEGDADNLRDLLRSMTDGRGLPEAFDANGPLGRMMGSLPDLRDLLPSNLPSLPELDLHGLSLPSMPSVSVPSVSGPSWSGGLSMGDGSGLHMLLWIVAIVVLGIVLWKVVHATAVNEEQARRWRLGPWPVAPARVSTRGELIVAFEYLALKLLGLDARTRNHLDLAAEFGHQPSADPVRQRAAARLAHLYEHARYAPPDEVLAEREMADARRDLCYLAGVAVA